MEETVNKLLQSIGLEKYSAAFQDNEIDVDSFQLLTKEDLQNILPGKMGPQLKIFQLIQQIGIQKKMDDHSEIADISTDPEVTTHQTFEQAVCFICLEMFSEPKHLWKHLIHIHCITQKRNPLLCLKCKSEFSILQSYKRHLYNCHSIITESCLSIPDVTNSNLSILDVTNSNVDMDCDFDDIQPNTNEGVPYTVKFLTSLQSSGKIPLNLSAKLVDYTSNLVGNAIDKVKEILCKHCDQLSLTKINGEIESLSLSTPFKGLDTQYKIEKYLESKAYLIRPREIILNESQIWESRESGIQRQTYDHLYHVPLKDTILKLLNKPDIFKKIQEAQYTRLVQNKSFRCSFHDGDYNDCNHDTVSEFIMHILVFNDDLEVCNPLGASKGTHKLNMTYFQILELPTHWNTKLDFLFLISVTKSDNLKRYGMNSVLKYLVGDLQELWRQGISFKNDNFDGTIKVKMLQLTGDNLSIQSALGFSEVFVANKFCRWCQMHRTDTHTEVTENITLLRSRDTLTENLAMNDFSRTGVQFNSIFNELEYFHVTDNKCPDIMHDILEGVALHDMRLFFLHLIHDLSIPILSIQRQILSYRFPFGNKSKPIITEAFINGGSSAVTASQAMYLVYALPLIFGHIVPQGDKYFRLVHLLLEIIQIVLSPQISFNGHLYLTGVIERHHLLYLKLSNQTLKPKHHHLLHYPNSIKWLGPLKTFWSMRFEAKHRLAKSVMHVSRNFCNVPKSVSKRFMLDFSNFLIQETEPDLSINGVTLVSVKSLYTSNLLLEIGQSPNDRVGIISKLRWKGTNLKKGDVMLESYNEEGPKFVKLLEIFKHNNEVILTCMRYHSVTFCSHFYAYIVEPTNVFFVKKLTDFEFSYRLVECTGMAAEDSNIYIMLPFKLV